MSRLALPGALSVLTSLPLLLVGLPAVAAAPHHRAVPTHSVTVQGPGTATWPAYSPGTSRFALRAGSGTDGKLTVTASTSDPGGSVSVNGRAVAGGAPTRVSGLGTGDEVNVAITDSSGTSSQSWFYLPPGFPTLTATGPSPAVQPGNVFLGLQSFVGPGFEAVVDPNGVPVQVDATLGLDMKQSGVDPTRYTVARAASNGGYRIDELDAGYAVLHSYQLAGDLAPTTDFHDAELLPGGRALLMGYAYGTHHGGDWVDAVIQIVDAAGNAEFSWNSKDHVDPSEAYVAPTILGDFRDYAHINSLQMLDDGTHDVVASFRNLSQVKRIATEAHDGLSPGDVVWTLGGAENDFTLDDPLGGPCAQHEARLLPGGVLRIFDNGSRYDGANALGGQTADMCPDPDDPGGARIARPHTRVVDYTLDQAAMTARVTRSYSSPGRYAAFAGSHQELANGDLLVGWSSSVDTTSPGAQQPIATEVGPDGRDVWSISAPGYFSYRVAKYDAPDAIAPVPGLTTPADGAVLDEGEVVEADFGCTDRGGSNLVACSGSSPEGMPIDTTVGSHAFELTARDGAGNVATRTVHYRARPVTLPDEWIRTAGGRWHGRGVVGGRTGQQVDFTATRAGAERRAFVRVTNAGTRAGRLLLHGSSGNRSYRIRYLHQGADVTGRLVSGSLSTPVLAAGGSYPLEIVLRRTARAADGTRRTAVVTAASRADASRADSVAATLSGR